MKERGARYQAVYVAMTVCVGLVVGLLAVEIWIRMTNWKPVRQIVHGLGLHLVDGVPVWEQTSDRYNRSCVEQYPERARILFFGSSITYGVNLSFRDVFTAALQDRLNQVRPSPGFCVLNFAQPGFAFGQKFAVARQEALRYMPALIMWEDWAEWSQYRMIGDSAYAVDDLRIRPDGFVGMSGVPDGLNRVLFSHSRLYEYMVLAFGERIVEAPGGEHGVTKFANTQLIQVLRLAQSVHAKLAMYLAPPLDEPFPQTAANPPDWHTRLLEFAHAQRIPAYPLQQELIDQDYLQLRLDPCCHFNASGHRALVPVMERIILEQLEASEPPPS